MCTDMRLLWPALGASAAVAVCLGVAAAVLQAATAQSPGSLAALITTLSEPGSERNPLRPGNTGDPLRDERLGVSIPRLIADDAELAGVTLQGLPDEDVIYAVRTVVNREGRISNFELILSSGEPLGAKARDEYLGRERAVFDAMQQTRFEPAQTPLGRAVAVDMVWVIAKTTAVPAPPVAVPRRAAERVDLPKPPDAAPITQPNQRSATDTGSPTA
jgi:hypothetical protein